MVHALYIDPGTGSLFLQILLASIFGALFAIKIFWLKLKTLTSKLFRKEVAQEDKEIS